MSHLLHVACPHCHRVNRLTGQTNQAQALGVVGHEILRSCRPMHRVSIDDQVATLFILAMLSLVAGLLCFLREIALATGNIHVVPR